jgi:hypothetical protein
MSHGPYDDATQWLLDQMHDPKVLLRHRIECAKILIETNPDEFNVRARWINDPDAHVIKIVIEGLGKPTDNSATESSSDKDHPTRLN